jgi:hypothetical protein
VQFVAMQHRYIGGIDIPTFHCRGYALLMTGQSVTYDAVADFESVYRLF